MVELIATAILSLSLFALTFVLRTPITSPFRPWDSVGLATLTALFLIGSSVRFFQTKRFGVMSLCIIALLATTLARITYTEIQFQETKQTILKPVQTQNGKKSLDPYTIGQHFLVGYRTIDEANALIDAGAIGGLFLSQRNIQGKTVEQIKQEIDAFQDRQTSHNRPLLFIATDQEGGIVSRLSPPLPFQKILGTLIKDMDQNNQIEFAHTYAASQAAALASVGVNLNFAPVVDIDSNIHDPNDRFSKISDRAIASDAAVVSAVAQQYVLTLSDMGILATLKHFPGLGSVYGDSHLKDVVISLPKENLAKRDWLPFTSILPTTNALVMIAHAKTEMIDPANPASVSYRLIHDILRGEMNIDNALITDDFSMQPIFGRVGGVGQATVDTLNAGTDLVLIAYDTDLLYEAQRAAQEAYFEGTLHKPMLEESAQRLSALRDFLVSKH